MVLASLLASYKLDSNLLEYNRLFLLCNSVILHLVQFMILQEHEDTLYAATGERAC